MCKPFVDSVLEAFEAGDIDAQEMERQLAMAGDWDDDGNPVNE